MDNPRKRKEKQEDWILRFFYQTVPGRGLLKVATRPLVSKLGGAVLDAPPSRHGVGPFIRRHGMDMSRFCPREYRSFNDFFTRRLRNNPFPPEDAPLLRAPCDGKLSLYPVGAATSFSVKHTRYRLAELLEDSKLAAAYSGGFCAVFRLTPEDFHRYHFVDDGVIWRHRAIPGVLHTVRPLAHAGEPVFLRNAREVTVLDTAHFGRVTQIEVGALLVGKICNHQYTGAFRRGEEKGFFAFGGSTVILLFEPDTVRWDSGVLQATAGGRECPLRVGTVLGQPRLASDNREGAL
jgi:phosphatidylserine decarboxylase